MVAAPIGTSEPHMAAEPRQEGGARTGPILAGPTPSGKKPDKPKANIMKRVGEQK